MSGQIILQGDLAGIPGPRARRNPRFYLTTDTDQLFAEIEGEWVEVGAGGGGPVVPAMFVAYQNAPQTIDAGDPPVFVPVVFDYEVAGDWTTPTPGVYAVPEAGLYEVEAHVTMDTPSPGNSYAIRLMADGAEVFKRESIDNNNGPIPNGGDLTTTMVLPTLTRVFVADETVGVEVSFNEAAPLDTIPGIQTAIKVKRIA